MKKKIFLILFFLLLYLNSNGQACGRYKVRIIGALTSREVVYEKIKIPRISTLEYKTNSEINNDDFIEFKIASNKIDIKTQSNLGSIYHDAESLKKRYQKENKEYKFILINNKTEVTIEIDWDKIKISKIESNEFGSYFEFDLGEVNTEIN